MRPENGHVENILIRGDNGGLLPFEDVQFQMPLGYKSVFLTRMSLVIFDQNASMQYTGLCHLEGPGTNLQIWGPTTMGPIVAGAFGTARITNGANPFCTTYQDFVSDGLQLRGVDPLNVFVAHILVGDPNALAWEYILRLELFCYA